MMLECGDVKQGIVFAPGGLRSGGPGVVAIGYRVVIADGRVGSTKVYMRKAPPNSNICAPVPLNVQ